jgi:bifunctional non-homologous end joining protein LigD
MSKVLKKYNEKRHFKDTPEPEGLLGKYAPKKKLQFIIQRHHASHLHYDFRLELNGVLKSWAIPKGPSLNPADKRLAMMVEDHPLSYAKFEGTIPKGNYGAGTVDIWDKGTYEPEVNPYMNVEKELNEELEKGNMKFILHGKKMKGSFALVKFKNASENSWLLIKHRDQFATDKEYQAEDNKD